MKRKLLLNPFVYEKIDKRVHGICRNLTRCWKFILQCQNQLDFVVDILRTERVFFYCLVSIKMDLKFNLIFFCSPFFVAAWNIIYPFKPKRPICIRFSERNICNHKINRQSNTRIERIT